MLPKINTLPGAQVTSTAAYRQGQAGIREDGADMRRHVVRTLRPVLEQWIPVRHQARHKAIQVGSHIRIGILTQNQRSARMVHKKVAQSGAEPRGPNPRLDVSGYRIAPSPMC